MIKRKCTLRLKLTFFTSVVFLSVCLLQAIISIYASGILAEVLAPKASSALPMQISKSAVMTVPVEEAQKNFNQISIISMTFLTSLGCGILYIVVRKELKPLESLSRQVADLNVGNPFVPLQSPVGGGEIQQVASAIDDMTIRVNDAYLIQKNFSANVAHELRTPLAVMQNKLEVFRLKEDRSLGEYETLNDVLCQNVSRLSALLDELLQFTNQNNVNMSMEVSLSDLAKEAAMELETPAAEMNLTISVAGEAILMGNDCLLQRFVFNLMQNAVKYNLINGRVQVAIEDTNNIVQMSVSDTGFGIPEDAKPHIFEPFFRVDKSRSREMGGSGLGLALVKRIVEQHGGSIIVSDNIPHGTIFQISFPKQRRFAK